MISIIRRYYTCSFLNSTTYEVELDITLKVTENPQVILLPIGSYRGDLKITNSEGKEFVLLSTKEYERVYGYSMLELKNRYIEKISSSLSEKQKDELLKDHRVIAILPQKTEKMYYEQIKMKWVTRMQNRKRVGMDEFVEVPIYFQRYGFHNSEVAAIYLSVKTVDKYIIMENLRFRELLSKSFLIPRVILNDRRHMIYRLDETKEIQLIQTVIKIAVPPEKIIWARGSFLASILVPLFIIGIGWQINRTPDYSFQVLAGLIALLIGQRVILFQDLNLMHHWNNAHLGAVSWCAVIILALIAMS